MSEQTPKECAACGGTIVDLVGEEFCSPECFRVGRTFCKCCGKSLRGSKRSFCNKLCQDRYLHWHTSINPSYLKERARTTCKNCGNTITQPENGGIRFFCNQNCRAFYRRTNRKRFNPTQEWGGYAPETRRVLLELQDMGQMRLARRLAIAIEREYDLHRSDPKNIRGDYITYQCKTCGKKFQRRMWGNMSKDYCSEKCIPKISYRVGEFHHGAKLTWEDVREIRHLHATGNSTYNLLAEMYHTTFGNIGQIIRNETWKPENDPRRKESTP